VQNGLSRLSSTLQWNYDCTACLLSTHKQLVFLVNLVGNATVLVKLYKLYL